MKTAPPSLGGDLLVTYTSQVSISEKASAAIRRWLEKGGRWFALHASNSVLQNTVMPKILGSRFITHPPYRTFAVDIAKPEDPLLEGIAPFEIADELYVIENVTNDIEILLSTRWGGKAFGGHEFEVDDRPLMYRRAVGAGGVLYMALGHANRPYDKPFPEMPDQPDYRGPWDVPVYQELIRRGVDWAAGRRPLLGESVPLLFRGGDKSFDACYMMPSESYERADARPHPNPSPEGEGLFTRPATAAAATAVRDKARSGSRCRRSSECRSYIPPRPDRARSSSRRSPPSAARSPTPRAARRD
jgi:type 1 glutamine amidotransferase